MKPADLLNLGPKREATEQSDGTWQITIRPPEFTGFSESQIILTADQYQRYLHWSNDNLLIQDALPELSASQREILLTGIGPEEWDKEFANDEE